MRGRVRCKRHSRFSGRASFLPGVCRAVSCRLPLSRVAHQLIVPSSRAFVNTTGIKNRNRIRRSSVLAALAALLLPIAACAPTAAYPAAPARSFTVDTARLGEPSGSQVVTVARVTPEFLQATGVHALLGRLFIGDDYQTTTRRVAVLGNDAWRTQFGGAPTIIGQRLRVNSDEVTVIGVMPENFTMPTGAALWLPRSQ